MKSFCSCSSFTRDSYWIRNLQDKQFPIGCRTENHPTLAQPNSLSPTNHKQLVLSFWQSWHVCHQICCLAWLWLSYTGEASSAFGFFFFFFFFFALKNSMTSTKDLWSERGVMFYGCFQCPRHRTRRNTTTTNWLLSTRRTEKLTFRAACASQRSVREVAAVELLSVSRRTSADSVTRSPGKGSQDLHAFYDQDSCVQPSEVTVLDINFRFRGGKRRETQEEGEQTDSFLCCFTGQAKQGTLASIDSLIASNASHGTEQATLRCNAEQPVRTFEWK